MIATAPKQFDQTRTFSRSFPDCREFRNASISITPVEAISRYAAYDDVPGFEVCSSHQNWTGAEWIQIVNKDDFQKFEDAVACAKEMRKYYDRQG